MLTDRLVARRLLQAPPWLTLVVAVILTILSASLNARDPLSQIIAVVLPLLVIAWSCALVFIATSATGRNRRWHSVLHASAAIVVVAVFVSRSTLEDAGLVGFVFLVLVPLVVTCFWVAASALVDFEQPLSAASIPKKILTFVLIFYLPIGIWFLHSRIQTLLAFRPTVG